MLKRAERFSEAGITMTLVLAVALLLHLVGTEATSQTLFDRYQRISPRTFDDPAVRVVLIDPESLEAVGPWPWPRLFLARLTEEIAARGAAVIGFDLLFPEPDRFNPDRFADLYPELPAGAQESLLAVPSQDAVMAEVLARHPVVLARLGATADSIDFTAGAETDPSRLPVSAGFTRPLPREVLALPGAINNIPEFDEAAAGQALINGTPDPDGVIRRVPLVANVAGAPTPGFALELARVGLGLEAVTPIIAGGQLRAIGLGERRIGVDPDGRMRLRLGALPPGVVVSAVSLLKRGFDPDAFRGRIVIVGLGAAGTADVVTTPIDRATYGTFVQAQAVDAIVRGGALTRPWWAPAAEWGIAMLLAAAAIVLIPRLRGIKIALVPMSVVVIFVSSSYLAFRFTGVLLDPLRPLLVGGAASGCMLAFQFAATARERANIHRASDRYLSPELVRQIVRNPSRLELGGEERDMTVLFCDIRGFSALTERLGAQQTMQFLIGYLTPMTDLLLAGKATIDKYVGDAIIAFWNAPLDDPGHAQNAADSALLMTTRLSELNETMASEQSAAWPGNVKVGIGLNAGACYVGNMGSKQRLDYSIIGDTVNLASRLEGLTKFYGVEIIVGSELANRILDYAILEIDLVRVVGRLAPEKISVLLGSPELAASSDFQRLASAHARTLSSYRSRNWDECGRGIAAEADLAAQFKLDRVMQIYTDRITRFREDSPPSEWDGVFHAIEK